MSDNVLQRLTRNLLAPDLNIALDISGGESGKFGAVRQSARQEVV